ncbi:hypothetical protein [Mycobacteroides abscessus]|uniref:hypothetical protein n=1 Tax=Mycobacteroides abscessus TaxID=36809 RepID=UPI00210845B3|nr:hypothetical protein [Mycobacteroides abscessus]
MDRSTALALGDTAVGYLDPVLPYANVFDPRMGAQEVDALVERIRSHSHVPGRHPSIDVAAAVREVIAERSEVAASQAFCARVLLEVNFKLYVAARHCRSGLRVHMVADTTSGFVNEVLAKASELQMPICSSPYPAGGRCEMTGPDPEGTPIVFRYGGLGIGTRVYQTAVAVIEDRAGMPFRVKGRPSTTYSHALRWKLHCQDPYRWYYRGCSICGPAGIDWDTAAPTTAFPTHERTDIPGYPRPKQWGY